MDHDLIVIGAGAAGLGAARAAAGRRTRVLLVSDGPPGGDCTFYGCVPSKTLIEAARSGLSYGDTASRIRHVVERIAATEDAESLSREGIEVRYGKARHVGSGHVEVDGRTFAARGVVIATGSRPAVPAIPGLDQVPYVTNETVFDLPTLPASLVVLGGGAVGCELAQAYARLGSEVTVLEAANRLLPKEEPAASEVIETVFVREGIDVRTNSDVTEVDIAHSGDVRLELADGGAIVAEKLLVAVGRTPITEGIAGVELDRYGHIVTNDRLATTTVGVYAAGDVTGRLPFTHAAYEMGRIAAANALGRRQHRYRSDATPRVTFTDPEVAHVGLTEAEAAAHNGRVAYLPMSEMDRAITADKTDGFIQLIAGPRRGLGSLGGGRILGATIVADRAGELIHEPTLAIATRMFAGRLAATTHAYPSWSYGIQLAAAQFFAPVAGRRARPARGRRVN